MHFLTEYFSKNVFIFMSKRCVGSSWVSPYRFHWNESMLSQIYVNLTKCLDFTLISPNVLNKHLYIRCVIKRCDQSIRKAWSLSCIFSEIIKIGLFILPSSVTHKECKVSFDSFIWYSFLAYFYTSQDWYSQYMRIPFASFFYS